MRKELFLLFVFILLPMASAKIVFTNNPHSVYNVGDVIKTQFVVEPEIPVSGFVESYLDCDEDKILFFKEFRDFSSNNKQTFDISFPASSIGNCTVESRFQNEKEDSSIFLISNEIDVTLKVNNNIFAPFEKISINGTAIKKNSENLEGLVRIEIGNFSNNTVASNDGKFEFELELPKLSHPGNYTLKIFAYEINSENTKINYGFANKSFEIKSWPTDLEIISEESLKPSGKLNFSVKLLDQVSNHLDNETVIVKIFDPYNNLVHEEAKKSGSNSSFYFESDSVKGAWKIKSYYGNIFSEKQIYIQENREVQIIFENSSDYVLIKNVGNSPYEGVIELFAKNETGNSTLALNLNLSIGGEEKYSLDLRGSYDFSTSDEEFGNYYIAPIIGGVISSKFRRGLFGIIFAIIILSVGGFLLFKKYREKILEFFLKFKRTSKEKIPEKEIPKKEALQKEIQKQPFYEKKVPEVKEVPPVPVHKSNEKKEEPPKKHKKIYSVFFNSSNENIKSLIKLKKYEMHSMGLDYFFVIIPSEEHVETSLLRLAKEMKMKNPQIGIVLNSKDFDKGLASIRSSFIPKEILKNAQGIFATEEFFKNVKKPLSTAFTEDKSFKLKERIIKLFYFHI